MSVYIVKIRLKEDKKIKTITIHAPTAGDAEEEANNCEDGEILSIDRTNE